jgi:hypothetical protein
MVENAVDDELERGCGLISKLGRPKACIGFIDGVYILALSLGRY